MRVGVDGKLLARSRSGISAFIRSLIEDLQTVEADQNEYHLLWPEDAPPPPDRWRNVLLRPVPVPPRVGVLRRPLYDQWSVLRSLQRLKPDVFLSPYFDVPVLYRGKTIVSVYDLSVLDFEDTFDFRFRVYNQLLLRRAIQMSNAIITISEASKHRICERLNVAADRVVVLYPRLKRSMAESDTSQPAVGAALRKYGIPSEFILYAGGFDRRKNLTRLVAAYDSMVGPGRAVPPLVMIGERSKAMVEALAAIRHRGTAEAIILPGFVEESDLAALYSACLFVVSPSLCEGFGLPLVEAMSRGKALCCSDLEVFHEIAGDAATYFSPTDSQAIAASLAYLVDNDDARAQLQDVGRARARRFTDTNNGPRLLELLASV